MSVILTGNLAMLLLRFGAVDPLEPSLVPPDDVLERASVTDGDVGRIGNSLQHGAANRWLRERGVDVMALYRGSAIEPADVLTLDSRGTGGGAAQDRLFALPPVPPLEFVVGRKGNPRKRERVRVHHCSLSLPEGFLLRVREELDFGTDAFIVHPALCLVVAAHGRSLAEIVEYAMGLCGSYALADDDSWKCVFDVPSLTRRDRLMRNVRALAWRWDSRNTTSTKRPPGVSNTLDALEFVLDRSASPMETKVATLLTLSAKLGGYGFTGLELNHRYELNEAQCEVIDSPYLLIDGWFDAARVGLEYDSDEFHGLLGEEQLKHDRKRVEAAALDGVQILTITRELLCDPERFDHFCWHLRELVGKRQRQITDWTRYRRDVLRSTLHLPMRNAHKFSTGEWPQPKVAA